MQRVERIIKYFGAVKRERQLLKRTSFIHGKCFDEQIVIRERSAAVYHDAPPDSARILRVDHAAADNEFRLFSKREQIAVVKRIDSDTGNVFAFSYRKDVLDSITLV